MWWMDLTPYPGPYEDLDLGYSTLHVDPAPPGSIMAGTVVTLDTDGKVVPYSPGSKTAPIGISMGVVRSDGTMEVKMSHNTGWRWWPY